MPGKGRGRLVFKEEDVLRFLAERGINASDEAPEKEQG
jgi:hypothetical protein